MGQQTTEVISILVILKLTSSALDQDLVSLTGLKKKQPTQPVRREAFQFKEGEKENKNKLYKPVLKSVTLIFPNGTGIVLETTGETVQFRRKHVVQPATFFQTEIDQLGFSDGLLLVLLGLVFLQFSKSQGVIPETKPTILSTLLLGVSQERSVVN